MAKVDLKNVFRLCPVRPEDLGEIFNPGMLNPVTQRLVGAGWY